MYLEEWIYPVDSYTPAPSTTPWESIIQDYYRTPGLLYIMFRGVDISCGFLHSHPVNYPVGVNYSRLIQNSGFIIYNV